MFTKVLVPVDGSAAALRAVRAAREIALRFGSQVVLLHIQYVPDAMSAATSLAGMAFSAEAAAQALERASQEVLRMARATLDLPEDRVREVVVVGHPAECICRLAQEGGYDLVVMGSRGLSEIRGFFLGSVSDKVSHHADRPVLIVH